MHFKLLQFNIVPIFSNEKIIIIKFFFYAIKFQSVMLFFYGSIVSHIVGAGLINRLINGMIPHGVTYRNWAI